MEGSGCMHSCNAIAVERFFFFFFGDNNDEGEVTKTPLEAKMLSISDMNGSDTK